MSVGGVARTVKEDISLFAFLPVGNAAYLLAERGGHNFIVLTVLSIFFSSMLYNYLRAETEDLRPFQRGVLIVVGLIWFILFSLSIYELYGVLASDSFLPEVLFSTSVLFIFLFLTDRIWDLILDTYEGIL